jgi:hypothetical protein
MVRRWGAHEIWETPKGGKQRKKRKNKVKLSL